MDRRDGPALSLRVRQAADCALAAYRSEPAPIWADFHFSLTDLPVRVAVYSSASRRYVAIEGTAEIRHWVSNLSAWRSLWHGLRVHSGFADVADQILPVFRNYAGESPVLCGHSLGGVVATLLAAALPIRCDVITFGAPKSGAGPGIAGHIDGSLVRLVNGSDAVPRLPWWRRHDGGRLIYLSNAGRVRTNPGMWSRFWDRTVRAAPHSRVTDHYMQDYRDEMHSAMAD